MRRREPFREKSNHELRRMDPRVEEVVDRSEPELRAKGIHRTHEGSIHEKFIGDLEIEPSQYGRQSSEDVGEAKTTRLDGTAKNDWLQMHGCERHTKLFVRDTRSEGETRSRPNGLSGREVLLNDVVDRSNGGQDETLGDHAERTNWMPEIRIIQCCLVFGFTTDACEGESRAFGQRLEYFRSDEENLESTLAECQCKSDVGVYVSGAAQADNDCERAFHR